MVYSASAVMAQRENGSQFHYVIKQGIWTGIGFVVMLVAMQVDYKHLKNRRVVYGLLTVTTVMLLAVFAFPPTNGAHRWIKLPRLLDSTIRTSQANPGDLSCILPGTTSRRGRPILDVLSCPARLLPACWLL